MTDIPLASRTNRQSPLHGKDVSITHEINVNVLSAKRQRELTEPLCPPPDVSFPRRL